MGSLTKRIVLFIAVNILVITMISIILSIFNVQPYLTEHGIDYAALMIFCLIWGMGGAFISLMLSRVMAKWMMGVQVLDPASCHGAEKELLDMVYKLSRQAGLAKMTQGGVYSSPEVDAFAHAPSRYKY